MTTQQEPNALTSPGDGKARRRQNPTRLWARAVAAAGVQLHGAAKGTHPKERGEQQKMQGLPSSHDLAENRAVHTAHGGMMRLGELNCETSEVAEFLPRTENWMESQRTCRTSQVMGDVGGTKSNGCGRQLTTVVEVGCEAFEAWRHAAVLRQKDSRI